MVKRLAAWGGAIGLAALLIWMWLGSSQIAPAPPYARVLGDPMARTYASPPCVGAGTVAPGPYLLHMTTAEARAEGFKPDATCASAGGFVEKLGFYRPSRRWNADGSWNW